ncbi:MAG: hypothetical protein Q7I99_07725 [Acholeplasmataceae bacterium]|nr:hypothetical protein [Acholeplasmataceae bacterium]
MKKVIGVKSKGNMVLNGIALTVGMFYFSVLLYVSTRNAVLADGTEFFLIVIILLFLILISVWIQYEKKPKNMIECDEEYIHLNYPSFVESIPLSSVIQVTPKQVPSRAMLYTFGRVIVHTEQKKYEIGVVSECEEVALEIMKLVKKKTTVY